jgi:hypothetical protein
MDGVDIILGTRKSGETAALQQGIEPACLLLLWAAHDEARLGDVNV